MRKQKNSPIAVLISDIHYNINTIEVADQAVRMAIDKANSLAIPLIVAGDLHDTKAHLRGECVNAMLKTFAKSHEAFILVGNHDKINEKSESHSLNFLKSACVHIVESYFGERLCLLPYHSDVEALRHLLKTVPKGATIIMHQGINGSNSGEYIQDRTALNKEDLAGFRVISGHYHQRQSFDLPEGGKFDYIGNPYTLNFGEANDPEKGFQVLYDDGSLEFIPTKLRKHVVYEIDLTNKYQAMITNHSIGDFVWLKVKGTEEQLANYKKPFECRIELIPYEAKIETLTEEPKTQFDLFDSAIDGLTNTNDERKQRLKNLYKDLIS